MLNRNSYLIDIRLVKCDEEGKCKVIGSYESDSIPHYQWLKSFNQKEAEIYIKETYKQAVDQVQRRVSKWEP